MKISVRCVRNGIDVLFTDIESGETYLIDYITSGIGDIM